MSITVFSTDFIYWRMYSYHISYGVHAVQSTSKFPSFEPAKTRIFGVRKTSFMYVIWCMSTRNPYLTFRLQFIPPHMESYMKGNVCTITTKLYRSKLVATLSVIVLPTVQWLLSNITVTSFL